MAVYKVPQDVEADDKLLGPFSFRQFIYLIVVVVSIGLAWGLAQLFIPLAILPLPFILFFGALALPLKKDQPMEIYLAALVSYYLKPRKRLWDPDGQQALVEITVPRVVEAHRTKDLSQDEAERRLSYLADIVDSQGWAVRGVAAPNSSMNSDVFYEAQQAEDILDDSTRTAHQIESQLDQASTRHREELIAKMRQPQVQSVSPVAPPVQDPYASLSPQPQPQPQTQPNTQDTHVTFNPYPSMQQSVIQPLSNQPTTSAQAPTPVQPHPQPSTPQTTSPVMPSPDIINLANNPDLSIETISREANRIKQKEGLPSEEVVISLH